MFRSWGPLVFLLSCSSALAQCTGDEPIVTTIPVVRGQGSPSACAGKLVSLAGVVTASLGGLNGFFLQDPIGDGDPTSSDAIFVLTGSPDNLPDPGSMAQVTGRIIEAATKGQSGSVTELDATAGSVQLTGVAPLPAAVVLDPGAGEQVTQPSAYFQALEGMLVEYPPSTVVMPSDDSGVFFTLRNDRLPDSQRVTPSDPGTGLPVLIDTAGSAIVSQVNELDSVPDLTGVLHFDSGKFRFEPVAGYDTASAGIAPQPAAADQPYISVASLDCQLLTAALPPDQFQTRLSKLAMAIRNELGSPDLIAVQGVGDEATLVKLAQAAGDSYFGLMLKGCDPANGGVGLIFNQDTVIPTFDRAYDIEAPQFRKPACTLPSGQTFANPLFENPIFRVDVTVADSGSHFTMFLNDWRSPAPGAAEQAQAGVALLQSILVNLNIPNLMVLGDFNQPENSDAMAALEQTLGVYNLSRAADPATRYSAIDAGKSEALDHIFVSPPLQQSVTSSGFAHYNADFSALPNRQDPTTPLRVADHDSPYVHFHQF